MLARKKLEQLKSDFIAREDADASRETEGIDIESLLFLQLRLSSVDLSLAPDDGATKAVLFKHEHVKLIMHFEQNHELPHFHIEFKREFNASYSIPTLERLAGEMPKKYENPMLEWAAKYLQSLEETWKRFKAREDIRELVIVADEGKN